MKISFEIDYWTEEGQSIYITGNLPQLGEWNKDKALELTHIDHSRWTADIEVRQTDTIEYSYLVKHGDRIIREEWGASRIMRLDTARDFYFTDSWHDMPAQKYLYTSAFYNSFFRTHEDIAPFAYKEQSVIINLVCPYAGANQEVLLLGETDYLGNWDIGHAIRLRKTAHARWSVELDAAEIMHPIQYKFALYDKDKKEIVHWEESENRLIFPMREKTPFVKTYDQIYHRSWIDWKAAGVSIPVFSLRTNKSFGVGEFSDLKMMVDWAQATGMKMIQLLPINDTTITRTWTDSYPYNAISIYALHPVYLGLADFPLQDNEKYKQYKRRAKILNQLKDFDYEKVLILKEEYLVELFKETGAKTLKSKDFLQFYERNESWLFPYGCFSCLRDKYQTADYSQWGEFEKYDRKKLQEIFSSGRKLKKALELIFFTQYLLHTQLTEAKEYAYSKGVVLKGDIPIGISRNSVDAWAEPRLFNLDTQTGAPPDDFSILGQNWGFPTYNWAEIAKNGYQWWINRFHKMADYFDAYRIDHILGFFRIWEIPSHSVQGLLGYFSPALPFTVEEILSWGFSYDEYRMVKPFIDENYLNEVFGEDTQKVIEQYLNQISWQRYELKEFCNTQLKIKNFFADKNDESSHRVQKGLFTLCNEVLFVHDRLEPKKLHPRITAQYTYSYKNLDEGQKAIFNRLYDHYFYERHNEFWRRQAMQKLPVLISSTDMLVCGEDLGMIPECVPSVMRELQILSLEIQRMPKTLGREFEDLSSLPYLSVCTTSTHDMSPLRAWWQENKEVTQRYYNNVLHHEGEVPQQCTPELCEEIVANHLNAPSMLVILPIQDWLSIDGEIRRENPYEERINIPAVAQHLWQYRMHLTIEELLKADDLNKKVRKNIIEAQR